MSVTGILSYYNKDYKDFRSLLSEEIKKPRLTFGYNLIRYNSNSIENRIQNGETPILLAIPKSRNSAIIGAAFDYYLRFSIEREFVNVISSKWVAELAIEKLKTFIESYKSTSAHIKLNKLILDKFVDSKIICNEYRSGGQVIFTDVLKACIFFAQMDLYYRNVLNPIDLLYTAGIVENADLEDLMGIIKICRMKYFKTPKLTVLNPTFGVASRMIGGADGDLIVDQTLIDIKVTKEFKLIRPYFNQLLCYYLLYLIGGVDNAPETTIERIGLYFARYNYLWTIRISELGTAEKFEKLKEYLLVKLKDKELRTD